VLIFKVQRFNEFVDRTTNFHDDVMTTLPQQASIRSITNFKAANRNQRSYIG
jgi:hypothetical protein